MRPTSPAARARLHMAKVGEERNRAGQTIGERGIFRAFGFQFDHVEDELPRGEQPAQRVGQRERHALARFVVELRAVGVGGGLDMLERPEPELHGGGERAGAGAGPVGGDAPHFGNPILELREEQLVGHGDGKLQALHGFRSFVGGFELGIHPFLAEESGTILRDAVTAHEADGFAHHVRAVAGVPELARRAKDIGQRIEHGKLHQRIGLQFLFAFVIALAHRCGR